MIVHIIIITMRLFNHGLNYLSIISGKISIYKEYIHDHLKYNNYETVQLWFKSFEHPLNIGEMSIYIFIGQDELYNTVFWNYYSNSKDIYVQKTLRLQKQGTLLQ